MQAQQACAEKEQAERDRADAERRAQRDRLGRRLGAAVAVIALLLGGFAIWDSRRNSADVAELAASGQVAGARAASLATMRGSDPDQPGHPGQPPCDPVNPSLFCINAELAAAGLSGVPDPGADALAYQVTAAVGRAGGRLDALREVRARGVALPGVNLPGPPGRFPRR